MNQIKITATVLFLWILLPFSIAQKPVPEETKPLIVRILPRDTSKTPSAEQPKSDTLKPQLAQQSPTDTTPQRVVVELKNGDLVVGYLIRRDSDTLRLDVKKVGIQAISITDAVSMAPLSKNGQRGKEEFFKSKNPKKNAHSPTDYQYLLTPTGFPMRKGESYYRNLYLGLSQFHISTSDNVSVTIGNELISTLAGAPNLYVNPQLNFEGNDGFSGAIGGVVGGVGGFGGRSSVSLVALPYAVGTYGSRDNHLTVGLGYLALGSVFGNGGGVPVLGLSGQVKLDKNFGFISENYRISGTWINTFVARFIGQNGSFDIGAIRIPSEFTFFVIGFMAKMK